MKIQYSEVQLHIDDMAKYSSLDKEKMSLFIHMRVNLPHNSYRVFACKLKHLLACVFVNLLAKESTCWRAGRPFGRLARKTTSQ